jgi:hypothetical protein
MKLFDIGNNYQMNMYKRMLDICYGAYGASRWNMTDSDRAMRAMRRYIENDIDSTARLVDAVGYGIAVLNHQCKIALPPIKDVIFNRPATIVFWADNTKTVVKCSKNDVYDPEKGLAMAIVKKAYGNKGNYCNIFSGRPKSSDILPAIKDIIYNSPATIVFWEDGSKTVVKCGKNDVYSSEKGLAMAIVKKAYGNKGNYYKVFSTWVEPELKYYSKNK